MSFIEINTQFQCRKDQEDGLPRKRKKRKKKISKAKSIPALIFILA
jgi:hypothetical protein